MADLLSEINALIAVGVDPTVAATTVNAERARKAQQGKRKHHLFTFVVFTLFVVFSCRFSSCIPCDGFILPAVFLSGGLYFRYDPRSERSSRRRPPCDADSAVR
jgi:hypothetical protein